MTAQNPPDQLLSQPPDLSIGNLNPAILSESLPTSFLSDPIVRGGNDDTRSVEEEDLYMIPGAHGTVAPIIQDQDHYDSRRSVEGLDFGDCLVGREEELRGLWGVFSDDIGESGSGGRRKRVIFIKGYSGVGKSALVKHFVMQVKSGKREGDRAKSDCRIEACNVIYGSGKFNDSGIPFSAFGELLERLVGELKSVNLLSCVQNAIAASSEIGKESEGNNVLRETWPALSLLLGEHDNNAKETRVKRRTSFTLANSSTVTMNSIKEYTMVLLTLFCDCMNGQSSVDNESDNRSNDKSSTADTIKQQRPHPVIILFLDDLQWADSPSLDLLSYLLTESQSLNIMFICAYRSNEVNDGHPLQLVIQEVTGSDDTNTSNDSSNNNNELELYPLSPTSIQQFIAQTLDKDPSDITDLSEVIYKKTMGNIFFVKQAMEELVRKNALYYDMMCFEWLFTDSRDVELLGEYISDDVVSSVRGKIAMLGDEMQRVLIVMGYIPNNALEIDVLRKLLESTGMEISSDALVKVLNSGVAEGMLLLSSESGHYIFAHDKIRQASKECIEGEARDEMLFQLANVLLTMHKDDESDSEWCIYVAVDYLNSFEPGVKTDPLELARLNLKVAKCARKKGAPDKEYGLLVNGSKCLKAAEKVWLEYELTLKIYNKLIESTKILGKFDDSLSYVKQVLSHARTLDDKLIAYRHQIALSHAESREYAKTLKEGIGVLEIYGFDFPSDPSAAESLKEEMKVKVALHNRPYSCLLDQPLVENPLMELFKDVTQFALLSGNDRLLKIIAWKAIRLGLSKGIDHHFHTILVCLGNTLAKEKEIKVAFEICNTAVLMSEHYREDRGNYAYTQLIAYQGVLFQLQSFRSGVDTLLQCYKDLKLDGQIDPALGSALGHFFAIFATGIPIGPLVESKLILIEEFAVKTGNTSFASIFQMQRQFLLNLWKTSENPTDLKGCAFNEEKTLLLLDQTSKVYSMTLRDTSTFRLMLAFIFLDENCMAKMLDILRGYPMSDMAVPRLHLRLAFMGLSAYALLGTKNKSFEDVAKSCLAHFKELSKLGSVNATPIYRFMQALKSPSIKSFELAISSCAEAQFPHLEAMAKEHYGMYLMQSDINFSIGQDYIVSSYWLYFNWGAHAKASIMRKKHECIKISSKDQANSRIGKSISAASNNSNPSNQKVKEKSLIEEDKKKRFSLQAFSRKTFVLRRKSKSTRDLLGNS